MRQKVCAAKLNSTAITSAQAGWVTCVSAYVSASGTKQTSILTLNMSASGGKVDMARACQYVR